jgi:phosphatidylserine decarboxylase
MTKVWDKEKKVYFTEQVFGEGAISFLYENALGGLFERALSASSLPSCVYGSYQDTILSRSKIKPFIKKFSIPMHEYEDKEFTSFNDFFIRKFRPESRVFEANPTQLPAPCEGRYLFFDKLSLETPLPVKGASLDLTTLLGDGDLAKKFVGGPGTICRLCPVDYHRFHFPDDGKLVSLTKLKGAYHFGLIAYLEVGALCVGKIVQSFTGEEFKRGEEKGYFLFGGSTTILLGTPKAWQWDVDLLEQSQKGLETYIKLGASIGRADSRP